MSNKNNKRISKATNPRAAGATTTDMSAVATRAATAVATIAAPAVVDKPAAWAAAWETSRMFGPGTPNRPTYDMDDGARIFDYQAGVNLYITPRSGYGLFPFSMLRNFADLCEEVRIVIEAFKREIRSMEWDIVKTVPGDKGDYSAEARRLKAFWNTPDGVTEFDAWLNAVLEDMLVTDAVTLWLEGDGRNITAVQQIDGATIRPLLDGRGRIPTAPIPGYMQAIKGMNWTWFTSEFLLYRPFNTSVTSPYGKSPIEYIITTINTSLLRKLSAVKYWDQTNVPEALVGLPDSMPLEAVTKFQDYFDTLLAGNIDKLRRIKFMPVQSGSMPVHEFRRPDGTTVADEWMLKMASWAFGFLPSEFGIVNGAGLGGKGFLEGQENTMYRFGVGPVIQYVQNLITTIVQRQTNAPLGFRFVNVGPSEDKKAAAELDEMQLRNGVIDLNVLREKAGQQPYPGAEPFLLVGNTPILLRDLFAPKPEPVAPVVVVRPNPPALTDGAGGGTDDPAANEVIDGTIIKMAMDQWREKCRRRVRDGKAAQCDPPATVAEYIPAAVVDAIKGVLATGPGSIEKAFSANNLEALAGALAKVKKKPLPIGTNQHPTATRNALEAALAMALAKAFKRAANAMPAVANAEDAAALAGGGPWWSRMRELTAEALTSGLMDGATIGIDEARHDPIFKPSKLSKALDEDPAGETATGPDLAESLTAAVGINWDLVNTDAEAWARRYSLQLVNDIEATTKSRMRRALAAFISSGKDDIDDLARTFTRLVDDPKRAQLIAQTESTRSFAQGNTLAWRAQGIAGRRWFNVEDSRVCPVCGALGGQVAALGKPFKSEFGEVDNPPAHPGCRCYVQPVETMPAKKPKPAPIALAPAPTANPTPVAMAAVAAGVRDTTPGDGPTVGKAVDIESGVMAGIEKHVMKIIDAVHSDGNLPNVPARTDNSKEYSGCYRSIPGKNGEMDKAHSITLSQNGNEHPLNTMAHEVGHYLDNQGLNKTHIGFASESAEFATWRAAVANSAAIQKLKALRETNTVSKTLSDGTVWEAPTNKKYLDYLLSDVEVFARSYAQYIALKSGNEHMKEELSKLTRPNTIYTSQWTDDDFSPIAAEIEALLLARGWLK